MRVSQANGMANQLWMDRREGGFGVKAGWMRDGGWTGKGGLKSGEAFSEVDRRIE